MPGRVPELAVPSHGRRRGGKESKDQSPTDHGHGWPLRFVVGALVVTVTLLIGAASAVAQGVAIPSLPATTPAPGVAAWGWVR